MSNVIPIKNNQQLQVILDIVRSLHRNIGSDKITDDVFFSTFVDIQVTDVFLRELGSIEASIIRHQREISFMIESVIGNTDQIPNEVAMTPRGIAIILAKRTAMAVDQTFWDCIRLSNPNIRTVDLSIRKDKDKLILVQSIAPPEEINRRILNSIESGQLNPQDVFFSLMKSIVKKGMGI